MSWRRIPDDSARASVSPSSALRRASRYLATFSSSDVIRESLRCSCVACCSARSCIASSSALVRDNVCVSARTLTSFAALSAASWAHRGQFRSGETRGTGWGGRPHPRVDSGAFVVISECACSSKAEPWLRRANRGGSGGDVCAPLEAPDVGEEAACNFKGFSGGGLLGSKKGEKATPDSGCVAERSSPGASRACSSRERVDIARDAGGTEYRRARYVASSLTTEERR